MPTERRSLLDTLLDNVPGFAAHERDRAALAERTQGMDALGRNREYAREMAKRMLLEGTNTLGPGRSPRAAPEGAIVVPNAKGPSKPSIRLEAPTDVPNMYRIKDEMGAVIGEMEAFLEGDRVHVNHIGLVDRNGNSVGLDSANMLGPSAMRELIRQFREMHPNIQAAEGYRVSGARRGTDALQEVPFGPRTKGPNDRGAYIENPELSPYQTEIQGMFREMGIPVRGVRGDGRTRYFDIDDGSGQIVTFRVPNDRHLGSPNRYSPTGNYFDLGTRHGDLGRQPSARQAQREMDYRGGRVMNEAGEMYGSNMETVRDAARWRFPNYVSEAGQNFLVAPEAAPKMRPARPEIPEAPVTDPNQLKLLSVAPGTALAAALATQEGPGRFSAPQMAPVADDQMNAQTRALAAQLAAATNGMNADFGLGMPTKTQGRIPTERERMIQAILQSGNMFGQD